MRTCNVVSAQASVRLLYWTLTCVLSAASCTGTVAGETSDSSDGVEGTLEGDGSGGASESGGKGVAKEPPVMIVDETGASIACPTQTPGPSPLRRLTRQEYNNIVKDVFGDTTNPSAAIPPDETGNGFGNDAEALSVSSLHAEKYELVAQGISARATATPAQLQKLAPCASETMVANELACAQTIVAAWVPKLIRRPLAPGEADELMGLFAVGRDKTNFATAIATVFEGVLQSPDFLYRIERGESVPGVASLRRPTSLEMATRLSFLYWGSIADDELLAAAAADELVTAVQIRAQASRMIRSPKSKQMLRYFFDNLLPIAGLRDLERDKTKFPTFSAAIGQWLREETMTFLERQILEEGASWPSLFSAPFTYLNEPLSKFYGSQPLVGEAFAKVALNPIERRGLLTQAGVMAGTTHSNVTSPVVRGSYVMQKLLCQDIPLPSQALLEVIKVPAATVAATARQRYAITQVAPCIGCHQLMDPVGFPLEIYDPIGLIRRTENNVAIDSSGALPLKDPGPVSGPVELAQKVSEAPELNECFSRNWFSFAVGRTMSHSKDDLCALEKLKTSFAKEGFKVESLLIELALSDSFRFLPTQAGATL
jgi:hypothetical protein